MVCSPRGLEIGSFYPLTGHDVFSQFCDSALSRLSPITVQARMMCARHRLTSTAMPSGSSHMSVPKRPFMQCNAISVHPSSFLNPLAIVSLFNPPSSAQPPNQPSQQHLVSPPVYFPSSQHYILSFSDPILTFFSRHVVFSRSNQIVG